MTKGDVYEALKEDHKNVLDLLNEIIDSGDHSKFPAIKNKLEVHMMSEENFLYPPMEFIDEDMVKKNEYEHDLAWRMLLYLDNTSDKDEEWMLSLKELTEIIKKHVKREEEELFPKASGVLSEEAEEDIMKLIEETKEENL